MDKKQEALDEALAWLTVRLKRATYAEGEIYALITKPEMTEGDKKRYDLLTADVKSINIKDVTGVIDALSEEEGEDVGFEEFE
ncbi:MAG: hypothetical protein IJS93_03325 [Clostridia bacterium]|nr:hypothetical protein [Clostridia bacterium]